MISDMNRHDQRENCVMNNGKVNSNRLQLFRGKEQAIYCT